MAEHLQATALKAMGAAVQATVTEAPDDAPGNGQKGEKAQHEDKLGQGPRAKGDGTVQAIQGTLAAVKPLQEALAELQNYVQLNGAADPYYSYLNPAIYWPAPLTPGIWPYTSQGSLVLQLDRVGVAPNAMSAAFALVLSTTLAVLMSQQGAGRRHE
ncbi:MAG: hypothetical protein ACREXP_14775 [Steroidobacteraceae bacterium]